MCTEDLLPRMFLHPPHSVLHHLQQHFIAVVSTQQHYQLDMPVLVRLGPAGPCKGMQLQSLMPPEFRLQVQPLELNSYWQWGSSGAASF